MCPYDAATLKKNITNKGKYSPPAPFVPYANGVIFVSSRVTGEVTLPQQTENVFPHPQACHHSIITINMKDHQVPLACVDVNDVLLKLLKT